MRVPEIAKDKPGVMDHVRALKKRNEIGEGVVIWGLMYGAELAISLAEEGKDVVLIGETGEDALAAHASHFRRWWIVRKLVDTDFVRVSHEAERLSNPRVLYNIKVEEIGSEGITIRDRQGKMSVLPFDTLIISRGREKNDALFEEIKEQGPEVHKIGDCAAAAHILQAVQSANEVARKI
jgi:thioredoxin reductase